MADAAVTTVLVSDGPAVQSWEHYGHWLDGSL